MRELVIIGQWEKAKTAIAECTTIDELKSIRDKAEALRAYAKQARESLEVQNNVAEIKLRAERRIGEFSKELPEAKANQYKVATSHNGKLQILKEAGIQHYERYEAIASLPQEKFDEHIKQVKERNEELTTIGIVRMAHVGFNSGENEWYTPSEYIESARKTMGTIDLDPASSEIANNTVRAKTYFTAAQDGLEQKWFGNIWMNPPYSQPLISQFSETMSAKFSSGEFNQACILVNNATETQWCQKLLKVSSAICLIGGRIRFINKEGVAGATPLQGQIIIYLGDNKKEFADNFREAGIILWTEE